MWGAAVPTRAPRRHCRGAQKTPEVGGAFKNFVNEFYKHSVTPLKMKVWGHMFTRGRTRRDRHIWAVPSQARPCPAVWRWATARPSDTQRCVCVVRAMRSAQPGWEITWNCVRSGREWELAQEASHQSFWVIEAVCVVGLRVLCKSDGRLQRFKVKLFVNVPSVLLAQHHTSVNFRMFLCSFQGDCWEPIRLVSTGTGLRAGSTWPSSGHTAPRGSSCTWRRLKVSRTRWH